MLLRPDKDRLVRALAARALGELKDRRAIEPLNEVLRTDEYKGVRDNAAKALGKLQGREQPSRDDATSRKRERPPRKTVSR
jgi:HEAT repeat protein